MQINLGREWCCRRLCDQALSFQIELGVFAVDFFPGGHGIQQLFLISWYVHKVFVKMPL